MKLFFVAQEYAECSQILRDDYRREIHTMVEQPVHWGQLSRSNLANGFAPHDNEDRDARM